MSATARRHRCDPLVPWEVPRDMTARVPEGMRLAGAGRCWVLGPAIGAATIKAADWGADLSGPLTAVMLVSALYADAEVSATPWMAFRTLYTRRPAVLPLTPDGFLKVRPRESRTGELWAFPLTPLYGPPRPLPITNHSQHD